MAKEIIDPIEWVLFCAQDDKAIAGPAIKRAVKRYTDLLEKEKLVDKVADILQSKKSCKKCPAIKCTEHGKKDSDFMRKSYICSRERRAIVLEILQESLCQ